MEVKKENMEENIAPVGGFIATGLAPVILDALKRVNFTNPTPIQAQAIPVALTGKDLIGIAQTGTGKTLAFTLPIIERLLTERGKALILAPTRELALQIEENIKRVVREMNPGIRTVCLIGGEPIYRQTRNLKMNPRIIIATPGRLQDHINHSNINLSDVKVLVLDEADRMLDMGFAPQINLILESVPKERQTMLFSATMPAEIRTLVMQYMKDPEKVEIDHDAVGTVNKNVKQLLCYVDQSGKEEILADLLKKHEGKVLVFTRTKHGATKLSKQVYAMGHTATDIHSNKSLGQRKQALEGFRNGKYRVLVATDVAARGIDVKEIQVVVNFDLPDASEDYIHRIGRTGRAGQTGLAVSFARHDQVRDVRNIERLTKQVLTLSEHSESPRPYIAPAKSGFNNRRAGQGFSSRRSDSAGYSNDRPSQGSFSRRSQGSFDGRTSHTSQGSNSRRFGSSNGNGRSGFGRSFSKPSTPRKFYTGKVS